MINRALIHELYDKYSKPPKSVDMLDLAALYNCVGTLHGITTDAGTLCIGSLPDDSPFKRIRLTHIHGIIAFDNWVAVVLRPSILFLNRIEPTVSIDIKPVRRPGCRLFRRD